MTDLRVFAELQEQRIRQRLLKHYAKPGPAQADPDVALSPEKARRPKQYAQGVETRRAGDALAGTRFFRKARIAHGTVRAYSSHKCRCALCCAARSLYDRTRPTRARDKVKKAIYNKRYQLKKKAEREAARGGRPLGTHSTPGVVVGAPRQTQEASHVG